MLEFLETLEAYVMMPYLAFREEWRENKVAVIIVIVAILVASFILATAVSLKDCYELYKYYGSGCRWF